MKTVIPLSLVTPFLSRAGLYLGYNAAIGSHADRLAWLSGLSLKGF